MSLHEWSHRGFVFMAQMSGLAVLVCLLVWKAADTDYFWPFWVILGVSLNLACCARLVYGRSR